MNLARWQAGLILGLIFILGIATGWFSVGLVSSGPRPPGPQQLKGHLMARMTQRLNLTDDQQKKIEPILAETAGQLQVLHQDELTRMSAIIEASRKQIAPLLTAEQQAEFDRMDQDRKSRFSRQERPWEGPPGEHWHGEKSGFNDFHGPPPGGKEDNGEPAPPPPPPEH